MNSLPKYVASRTLDKVHWNNSTLINGDLAKEIGKLKEQPGQDIAVHGSGDLVQTLMKHDLVDEYRLMVFPIVLGSGKRIFQDDSDAKNLKLSDSKTFRTGVVVLTYAPAAKDGERK
jgi:dihydrofolate reductase